MEKLYTNESKENCLIKLGKLNGYAFMRLSRTFALTRSMSHRITAAALASQSRQFGCTFEGTITETERGSMIEGCSKILRQTWIIFSVIALAAVTILALWFKFSPPFNNIYLEGVLYVLIIAAYFFNLFIRLRIFDKKVREDMANVLNGEWKNSFRR